MNPETNMFEQLSPASKEALDRIQRQLKEATQKFYSNGSPVGSLVRPDGSPVPENWLVLEVGQRFDIEAVSFEVVHIGERYFVAEPRGYHLVGAGEPTSEQSG